MYSTAFSLVPPIVTNRKMICDLKRVADPTTDPLTL